MSLYALLRPNGPSGFGMSSTAEEVTRGLSLEGKTILVTGCSSGIGFETARVLAQRGANVIAAARSEEKAASVARAISAHATGLACDLAEPASIRASVGELKRRGARLDAIICNAGIMAPPRLERVCGYESQFFINHIGHFMLVTALLDALADRARVVVVSSEAHRYAPRGGIDFDNLRGERSYRPWTAYARSKLANLLFAKALARRLDATGKTANAVHPGVVPSTEIFRGMALAQIGRAYWPHILTALAAKTVPEGAATSCYVAVNPKAASVNGQYFSDCNVARPRAEADDPALGTRLWELSEQIAGSV
ncbi:MAG: SDR family oxidoreductase [Bradyrhizobium sp.]|nr:SDR family oxidoreductase [Bradyrhizobium sp.]